MSVIVNNRSRQQLETTNHITLLSSCCLLHHALPSAIHALSSYKISYMLVLTIACILLLLILILILTMGESWLGSTVRSPLLSSTQQSYVFVALVLALSHCHLTSIVHSQSADLHQLLVCLQYIIHVSFPIIALLNLPMYLNSFQSKIKRYSSSCA